MTRKIKNLTGPGETTRFGMEATDLGIPVRMPDGRLLFIFGDTFREARVGGGDWRSPVGLISTTRNLDAGITFSAAAGSDTAYARQLLPYRHGAAINGKVISTVLPTDAIAIDNRIYLHVMVCQELGKVHWTEFHVSGDNGTTWEPAGKQIPGEKWGGRFQMLTWESGGDGYIYVYSTGFQRDKGVVLSRVPQGKIADHESYEPWGWKDDRWAWGNDPTEILAGRFGELNLRKVEKRWVLTCFDAGNYRIDSRVFDSPTENLLTAPRTTICHGGAWGREGDSVVAQLYGGYVIPGSTLKNFHVVISQWNTERGWPYRSMHFMTDLSRTLYYGETQAGNKPSRVQRVAITPFAAKELDFMTMATVTEVEDEAARAALARAMMTRQAALSIRVAAVFLILIFGLPLVNWLLPQVSGASIGGFTFTWLLLGVLFYPITWLLSGYFIRESDRIEAQIAAEFPRAVGKETAQ